MFLADRAPDWDIPSHRGYRGRSPGEVKAGACEGSGIIAGVSSNAHRSLGTAEFIGLEFQVGRRNRGALGNTYILETQANSFSAAGSRFDAEFQVATTEAHFARGPLFNIIRGLGNPNIYWCRGAGWWRNRIGRR